MRAFAIVLLLVVLIAGCDKTGTKAVASPSPTVSAASVATDIAGGCGSTQAHQGGVPQWVDVAGAHHNPDGLPYVIADPSDAAGFLFGYPLRAGHPTDPTNKILWVVRIPRDRSDLTITAHPADAAAPSVTVVQPADSSPGEIYPSIVDVPGAGCWHLDLRWAGHNASVDLTYL